MEAPGEGGQEAREPSIKTPHVDTIAPQAEHHMDDAPDPDEDDLDDLDGDDIPSVALDPLTANFSRHP